MADEWYVPESIDLEEDQLVWTSRASRRVRLRAGLLVEFGGLVDAQPERILHFARRWGVLGLCKEHGLSVGGVHFVGRSFCEPGGLEPGASWRYWARQARAVVNIATRLHENELGRMEDFKALYTPPPIPADPTTYRSERIFVPPPIKADLQVHRRILTSFLNQWLDHGKVVLRFRWPENGPEPFFQFGSYRGLGLFGALAAQLALFVGRTDGLAICSGCGNPYIPKWRRPKPGQRRYCNRCRERGTPVRDAQRDLQTRKKNALELARQKVLPTEIASRLNTDVRTVRRWAAQESARASPRTPRRPKRRNETWSSGMPGEGRERTDEGP